MKTRYFYFLAAAVLLAGCNKEVAIEQIQPEGAKTVLTVGLPSETKTVMDSKNGTDGHKVYWSPKDQIAVNGIASVPLADDFPEETSSAEFTVQNGSLSTPYRVVYPASITTHDDYNHVTLPAVQTYKDGGFADGMFPMAGYVASGSDLELSYLCSIVKISVTRAIATDADADNIVSVRFQGKAGEQVSGVFTIDYVNATLTGTSSAAKDKVVKVVKSQATSTTTAIDYYIVVPARTYASGFNVIVQDSNGHIMTKSKSASWTPEAGKLYVMPPIDFEPTATELGVEISNAAEFVQFAKDYKEKKYEAEGSSLIVTVTQDITFDAESSAAFNATGGIGTALEENRFGGLFNGRYQNEDHTISGLHSTVPLFNGTSSSGTIKNLTIDNTCSFTFSHPNSGNYEVGPVVGYHRGTLDHVSVAANVALADADVTEVTALGGLVGRVVVGTIDNCTYSGALSVPAGFKATDTFIYIGGLAGNITNTSGKVQNSHFEGTLENEGQLVATSESDDMKSNPHLIMGGIVGLNSGTVSSCETASHATGITVTLNDGSDHDFTGTIVTHSTIAYHYALAGITGRNDGTVDGCTNNAVIVNIFSAERGSGGNMNGRYLEVGGVAGYNASGATITGCDNSASTIVDRANPKIHYVGGIAGRNYGTVYSSASFSTIGVGTSYLTPYGARMPYIGGVVGSNENGATLSAVDNEGNINVSRIETTTGFICRIGGIAGYSNAPIDGASGGGSITNTGDIAQSTGIGHCSTPSGTNDYGYHIGGIVGYATKAVKNVTNDGNVSFTCTATGVGAQYVRLGGVIGKIDASSKVDIEKCANTGNVTYTASATYKANNATRYYYNYMGGIVGYANNAAIKGDSMESCANSGVIKGGDGAANNNTNGENVIPSFIIGGIVGYITGDSSIEYCDLSGSGNAYNDHWSNRGIGNYDCPIVGGIVGQVAGADGAIIPVSNCSIASKASVNARRGAIGGIVGIAQYSSISNCVMPVKFEDSQAAYFYGGIAALANNTTISNCEFKATTIRSSQIQIGGGIVGQLEAGSTIDGCRSEATDISKNGTAITPKGGIAGKSVAGSTIKNSHYKSAIGNICGDTNFNDGGNNAADL